MVRLHDIEEILSGYCDNNSYSKCEEVGPSSPVLKPFIYITVSVSISYNFEQEYKTFKYYWIRLQEYAEDGVLKRQINASEEGKSLQSMIVDRMGTLVRKPC
jgi:hypothetical protein